MIKQDSKLGIRISEQEKNEIIRAAEQLDVNVSKFVRIACAKYIAQMKREN